jgi:TonB family protein
MQSVIKQLARVVLAMAFAVSVAPAANAFQAAPVSKAFLDFKCQVADGPVLKACTAVGQKDSDPAKVEHQRSVVEKASACALNQLLPKLKTLAIGSEIAFRYPYNDAAPVDEGDKLLAVKNPDLAPGQPPLDLSHLYPAEAADYGLPGHALIKCRVNVDGQATACQVAEEKPAGYGFGKAALAAIRNVRFTPMLVDCLPIDGGYIQMPINFQALG